MKITTMADLLQHVLLVLLFSVSYLRSTACQGTCRPHDIREVSQSTYGFPSVFHIEVLEGQADLHVHSSRQVLIPAMRFNCSGRITRWIFPARWEGHSQAFLQLQVWRRATSVSNTYVRTGATTVQANNQSSSQVYEIPVNPPLLFWEGDIVGYFQPHSSIAQLNLFLEDSEIISTFRDNVDQEQTEPPIGNFNLDNAQFMGEDYPLIAIETDPLNCGCGMVTQERINTLLTADRESFGPKTFFPQEQVIFPGIHFTGSGRILRWIVAGSYMSLSQNVYPEVQLWRPTGNSTYRKLNGTTVIAPVEVNTGIYEFPVDHPLPFEAGDIIGIFQPPLISSKLQVDYDSRQHAANCYLPLSNDQLEPFHTLIDVRDWQTGNALPLVSVVIALDVAATTTTITPGMVATPTQTTPMSPAASFTPSISSSTTTTTTPYAVTPPNTGIPSQPLTPSVSTPLIGSQQPISTVSQLGSFSVVTIPPTQLQQPTTPTVAVSKLPSVQTTSVPVVVDSASTDSAQGLMFYISLGVVGMLLTLICVLIVILVIVIKSPRRRIRDNKQLPMPAIHVNPESGSTAGYEMYTDVADEPPQSVQSQSPNNVQHVFDDPIYNAPETEQEPAAGCKLAADLRSQAQSKALLLAPAIISAYAISNVHCTTSRELPTISEQSDDYDYADP